MACDENLSRSLKGGHEPFYDFPCSLCEKDGKHMEAVSYCEDCIVFMCTHCLTHHDRFPVNAIHSLLNQSQFTTVNLSKTKVFPTKRCARHPGELLSIFCEDHGVVCCTVCKSDEHSSCTKTQPLSDAVKDIRLKVEHETLRKETEGLLFDVCKLLTALNVDTSRIATEKEEVKRIIADFRFKVNAAFDKLERNSLNALSLRENQVISRLDQDTKYLSNARTRAGHILEYMKALDRDNEYEYFFQITTVKKNIREVREKVQTIAKSAQQQTFQFRINHEIETYLSSVDGLGEFSDTNIATSQPAPTLPGTLGTNIRQSDTFPAKHDALVATKAQLVGKFNIQETSDSQVCHIVDMCHLSDGNVLVTDQMNMKLKRLGPSYKLLDSVRLTSGPHSICATGTGQAAVSLFLDKTIQFVAVGNKLTLTKSFRTAGYCRGMAYLDNKLYVCCGDVHDSASGRINLYNITGDLLHSIPRVQIPIRLAISECGHYLFVTSWKNDDVAMLDLVGHVVNVFNDMELRFPLGICTNVDGQVIVTGYNSDTVMKMYPMARRIELVLNEADGIRKPKGVCYDKLHSTILVSCLNSNEIHAFR